MILQILARCGAFFIGFVVKGQMNHDFAFGIEVNPCVIEITIGNKNGNYLSMTKYVSPTKGYRYRAKAYVSTASAGSAVVTSGEVNW